MHPLKKLFQLITGYYTHKVLTLPTGISIELDIKNKIGYDSINTVFDVGANTGQTVEWIRGFLPNTSIFCFEPIEDTFKKLKTNVASDKKVRIEQIAFGNTPGKKIVRLFEDFSYLNSLREDLMNADQYAKTEEITIYTIDQYCSERGIIHIDFLKIDTEGYEIQVLEGAEKLLSTRGISMIYCEVGFQSSNSRNTNLSELIKYLEEKGFYFFSLYQLMLEGWGKGDYFGNALFVNKGLIK